MELKKYPSADISRYSSLFFSIGLCTSLLLTTLVFEWKTYDNREMMDLGEVKSNFEEVMEIPPTKQAPPPPRIIQPNIIPVIDEVEIMEDLEIDLDIEITQETVIEEQIISDFVAEEMEEEEVEEIFVIVQEQPSPKGGYEAFYRYFAENLEYPRHARSARIEGKVFVQFIVNPDGALEEVVVLKGIGGGCDEEAVRVLKNTSPWQPGKQRGKAVKVRMVLPITFNLTDTDK